MEVFRNESDARVMRWEGFLQGLRRDLREMEEGLEAAESGDGAVDVRVEGGGG